MDEDEFQQKLDQHEVRLKGYIDERLADSEARNDKRFERIDRRFEAIDKRFDAFEQRVEARMEQLFAKFFGQVTVYVDTRLKEELDPIRAEIRELRTVMDGIAKRLETDEQERAILTHEQDKHAGWIRQLAKATDTKLVPEQ